MRTLVDVTTWVPGRTGIGLYTERLLSAWAQTFAEDHFVLASNLRDDDAHLPAGRSARVGPVMPSRALWMQTALPWAARKSDVDVALFPNYMAPVTGLGPVPVVITVHDMAVFLHPKTFTWKKRVLQRRLLPRLVRQAAAILTPSESTRRDLIRLVPGLDPRRIVAVHLAADPACHQPVEMSTVTEARVRYGLHERYLLAVGTLEPRKNLVRLIEAFEPVGREHPDVQLVLVGGRGWRDAKIAAALRDSPVKAQVVAPGYVPFDDLKALYRGSVAMCYPSLYEGFGLPVIEAMACGAPVLTSVGSSLDEVASGAALQVEPLDVSAISDGMSRLLIDDELRERLRSAGAARAAALTWESTARGSRAVIERVARGELPSEP